MSLDLETEKLFGEIALSRGLITADQLSRCLALWEQTLRAGKRLRLGEVMMAEKFITKEQALDVLKEAHLRRGDKPKIGGYILERVLGKGAMGNVYLARQISMDRMVAIKLLPRSFSQNPEFVKRFMREVKTSAKLHHPNIVSAIDAGESNGYHYFAMEYVEGRTVERLIQKHEMLDEEMVISIAIQTVMGLMHAAEQGIIHRDIKPANIMVCKDGLVKIMDMGLAIMHEGSSAKVDHAGEDGEPLTTPGMAVGTPYYMAPEQVEGRENIDFRADIYALGATLYEAVTGKKPFDGANVAAIMAKRLYEQPLPPHQLRPDLNRHMSNVIMKMMARKPEERYQRFSELMEDLERLRNKQPPQHAGDAKAAEKPHLAPPMERKTPSKPAEAAPAARSPIRATKQAPLRRIRRISAAVFSGALLGMVLGMAALVFLHRWARKPLHPCPEKMDAALWQETAPPSTKGEKARLCWLEAESLQIAMETAPAPTAADLVRLRSAYKKVITEHPGTAYAALAQKRLGMPPLKSGGK